MLRLYHWVSTLRWAPHVQEDEWGVSWIELFLSFQMSTESDVPFNLGTDDRPLFTLPEHNEAVNRIKPATHKRMICFETSLRALENLGGRIIPLQQLQQTSKPPGPRFLPGTTRSSEKAVFPFHEDITQALRNKAGCPVIIGDLPTLVADIRMISIPLQEGDTVESQWTRRRSQRAPSGAALRSAPCPLEATLSILAVARMFLSPASLSKGRREF